MAMFTVSGGVPAGRCTARLAGVETQPEKKEKGDAARVRWKLTTGTGPHSGKAAFRITVPTPIPKNGCGKTLSGLVGRAVSEGEQIDPGQDVGKRLMPVVAVGQGGWTRVEAIVPMAQA